MAVPSTGPPMSCSSGTSSEHAYLHTWEYSRACGQSESRHERSEKNRSVRGRHIHSAGSIVSHIEEELVGEHVDGELLVAEGVDAGRAAAGRRPDLERDRPHGLPHAGEQPDEVLVRRRLGQELLLPHHSSSVSLVRRRMARHARTQLVLTTTDPHAPGCRRSRTARRAPPGSPPWSASPRAAAPCSPAPTRRRTPSAAWTPAERARDNSRHQQKLAFRTCCRSRYSILPVEREKGAPYLWLVRLREGHGAGGRAGVARRRDGLHCSRGCGGGGPDAREQGGLGL